MKIHLPFYVYLKRNSLFTWAQMFPNKKKLERKNKHTFYVYYTCSSGHAVAQWLRHYDTSRAVAGSRLDEVNTFSNLPNPSGHIMRWGALSL
jgi:hypothetical protein